MSQVSRAHHSKGHAKVIAALGATVHRPSGSRDYRSNPPIPVAINLLEIPHATN